MLFTWDVHDEPPKLSGVIDWDYSWTGSLYYLYDYPCFILDNGNEREKYEDNRVLRKVFVRCLARCFANGSQERRDVQECFRQKSYVLNQFTTSFTGAMWRAESEHQVVSRFLAGITSDWETRREFKAYGGIHDWGPDSEQEADTESDDTEDEYDSDENES